MNVLLDSEAASDADCLAQVPGWFENWERTLSRFRADSELMRLNQQAGQPMPVSPVLWEMLTLACEAAQWSAGLVTPTILPALKSAGYDRSFELLTEAPSEAASPTIVSDWRTVRFDVSQTAVTLPIGMELDLGGLAKGWAADNAAQRLSAFGPALVDAGGDIAVSGLRADGQPWPIEMADPLQPDETLEILRVEHGGVATSGRDYRKWQRNGQWQHHLIDPRTGRPAETEVLSATVLAPTAREAEVAAKTALLLGCEAGLDWLDARPSLAGLLVTDDGAVHYSQRSELYFWK